MPHRTDLVRAVTAAAVLSALWIGVNADKPMHTDDPFVLYWARAIAPAPGDHPARYMNWLRYEEPMLAETQHTAPGWAIVLAGARHLVGEHARPLHWLQWPFATMFLAGVFLLAGMLGAPPWAAMLICGTSPAFLVPAASLLGDIPAVGLAMLGLAVWHAAPTLRGRLVAVLLLGLAGQMKQSVLVLVPLLVLTREGGVTRNPRDWILTLLALLLAGTYPDVAPHDPARPTILGHVAWIFQTTWYPALLRMKLSYLAAAAGSLVIPVVPYAISVMARTDLRRDLARARVILLGVLSIPLLSALGFWKGHTGAVGFWQYDSGAGARLDTAPPTANTVWFYFVIALFVAWGLAALRPRRSGAPVWLHAWLLLAVSGFVAATWFPAVRHLIPLLPPLVMVFLIDLRRFCGERAARLAVAAAIAGNLWLGLSLARNDYVFARFAMHAADRGAGTAAARHLPLLTTGSWGLRYYVERNGGRILERSTELLPDGAIMLYPSLTDRRVLPAALRKRGRVAWTMTCPPSREWPLVLPAQTIPPMQALGAFHGGYVWFPYAFTRSPSETIRALEIRPAAERRPVR